MSTLGNLKACHDQGSAKVDPRVSSALYHASNWAGQGIDTVDTYRRMDCLRNINLQESCQEDVVFLGNGFIILLASPWCVG